MTLGLLGKIDSIDKEILRVLQKRRPMVSRQIAKSVGISAVAVSPRLLKLKDLGIIKVASKSRNRIFKRKFGKEIIEIKSPRSIHWDLDLLEE